MKPFKLFPVFLSVSFGVLSCGADKGPSEQSAGHTQQALSGDVGHIPVPCVWSNQLGRYKSVWDGNTVELVVADVSESCSKIGDVNISTSWYSPYVASVTQMASATVSAVVGATGQQQNWLTVRQNSSCDLANNQQRPYDLKWAGEQAALGTYWHDATFQRGGFPFVGGLYQLSQLAYAACVAHGVNDVLNSGAGLLLPQDQQLELANVARVHAQRVVSMYTSMVGIAGADEAGTADGKGLVTSLQYFFRGNDPVDGGLQATAIAGLQQDFANSLQVLLESGKELGSLMGRSRAAKDDVPGGSSPTTYGWSVPADRVWGPGSWTHREAALQLGGEPLGINPGAGPVQWHGSQWGADIIPYVKTDASAPQVATVLKLARQLGPITLNVTGSGGCRPIDVTASTAALTTTLTNGLNARACPSTVAACSSYVADPLILQKGYSISPQHVQTAVQLLAEMLGSSLPASTGTTSTGLLGGCGSVRGAQAFRGTLSVNTSTNVATLANWDFAPRGLEDIGARVANATYSQGSLRIPLPEAVRTTTTALDPVTHIQLELNSNALDGDYWGGAGTSFLNFREQVGVLPTLVAARHVLSDVVANKPNTTQRMLPAGAEMVKALDSAIGSSVYMVPDDIPQGVGATGATGLLPSTEVVRIAGDAADPFWVSGSPPVYLLRVINTPWTGDLVRFPETTINGATIKTVLAETLAAPVPAGKMSSALTFDTAASALGLPVWRGNFTVDQSGGQFALVAVRFDSNPTTPAQLLSAISAASLADMKRCTRLLGASVSNMGTDFWHGMYLASGGAFGTALAQQLTGQTTNPTVPAFDGFGLPTDWVPPFSAEVLGGDPLTTSAAYYMSSAKEASQNASAAVQRAVDGLLTEEAQVHDADLSANAKAEASRKAKLKAQQGLREEQVGLCGTQNPKCSVNLRTTSLQSGWYSALATPLSCPTYGQAGDMLSDPSGANTLNLVNADPMSSLSFADPSAQVNAAKQNAATAIQLSKCLVRRVIDNFLGTQFQLADKVEPLISQATQPAFTDYSGGSVQNALIEQWAAIKAPGEQLEKLTAGLDAAQATIEAANAVIVAQAQDVRIQCSAGAFARAFAAGWSAGFLSATWSAGPLVAQQERCDSVSRALGPEIAKAAATNKEAYSAIADRVQGITDSASRIAKSGATLAQLTTQANLAAQRVAVEQKLDQLNPLAPMSQGLFRQFRAYDIWRARALIENARRYAVAARRAVEARYTVNLSTLSQDEAFVKSPTTWADDVYKYDLSLPSAVGLSSGTAVAGGIYANVVEDYVTNLQSFVNGYAVQRPTATAKDDVEVLLLPGLADGTVTPRSFTVGATTTTYYTAQSRGVWMLHCPVNAPLNKNAWTYLSGLDAAHLACDATGAVVADTARLYFSLDPWGRVNGNLANPPYDNRYNARWQRLAVNLVGTAIRDCTSSADPQACYNTGFVRYDLRHQGISWVTDFAGQWRAMNVPPGIIEGGKALAIEAWLDPLKNGWDTSYLSAIARTEYAMRPFGGDYMLELQGGPDVHLERIERIQLMAGMAYWVAQK